MMECLIIKKWVDLDPGIGTRVAAEIIGCTMFHFIGSVAPTAVANAVALMVIVYFTAKQSGAHINPAISLTFTLLGHTNPIEFIIYSISQIIGCIFGAFILKGLVPKSFQNTINGCFVPQESLSYLQIWGWETVGTAMFIMPVFSVVWYMQNKTGYGTTGPIMIGLSLLASAYAAGPWTGASFNPSRTLASPIVLHCVDWHYVWIYILGELMGAMVATTFILPWYGIATKAWYRGMLSKDFRIKMAKYVPNIVINTLDMYIPANIEAEHDV